MVSATPEILPFVGSLSTRNLALLSVAAAVLIFFALTLLARAKSNSRGNSVLLVGPPDAGKTAIFSSLVYNQALPSHTSLQINSAHVVLPPSKTLRIVDVPGHPRIRDQFREHLRSAKAIVFVVDASTVSRNAPAVAEHMHHVFHAITSLPPSQPTPKVLVLAHKTNLVKTGVSSSSVTEVAIARVRTVLERELEKRKASQAGGVGVESMDAESESELGGLECGGTAGSAFKFSEWDGGEVDFIGTWIEVGEEKYGEEKGDQDGLRGLKDWLEQLLH
ncbi:signal recognition particle receptor beta subunit-domain-containing protein [Pisolithus croceorrhizus]|nr:signal recognition particle receptor beta subunit-domain-containing protein [Pisolithus croceorrhizus]